MSITYKDDKYHFFYLESDPCYTRTSEFYFKNLISFSVNNLEIYFVFDDNKEYGREVLLNNEQVKECSDALFRIQMCKKNEKN